MARFRRPENGREREARRRKISLSAALDLAAQEWLKKQDGESDDAARQQHLQRAAAACFGKFASGSALRVRTAGGLGTSPPKETLGNALVDTGAILALLDRSDRWHRLYVDTFSSLHLPRLTSEAVLTELFH